MAAHNARCGRFATSAATAIALPAQSCGLGSAASPTSAAGRSARVTRATIADPGLPGAQIAVHVLHVLQQDTLPGLQFDQAIQQLVEVVQQRLQDALPGFEQIADDPDRLVPIRGRQTRQPADEPGTFARQVALEAPQLTGELDDAQLRFVDRNATPFQALLVNDDGRQLLDPLADQDAGRKGPAQYHPGARAVPSQSLPNLAMACSRFARSRCTWSTRWVTDAAPPYIPASSRFESATADDRLIVADRRLLRFGRLGNRFRQPASRQFGAQRLQPFVMQP